MAHIIDSVSGYYVNFYRLKNDVTNLLNNCASLTPSCGRQQANTNQILLYLTGTISITFSNNTYHIPVSIFFDTPYPSIPPRCYVTPTSTMAIKERHKHVDLNGVIYLPYLNQWNSNSSNLVELVTMMCSVFSIDPPVYSKSANTSAVTTTNNNNNNNTSAILKVRERLPGYLTESISEYNNCVDNYEIAKSRKNDLMKKSDELRTYLTVLQSNQPLSNREISTPMDYIDYASSKDRDILDLICDYHSLDDYLSSLDDRLISGNLKCQDYVKEFRQVSRQQFYTLVMKKQLLDQ